MTNESRVAPGNSPEASAYDEMNHGLSWYVVPDAETDSFFIEHGGGGAGFATAMRLYPDRNLGMVIMANGTYPHSSFAFSDGKRPDVRCY